ncbi:MAG: hypothetical protein ACLVJ6_09270 [Merdibacter sp.]
MKLGGHNDPPEQACDELELGIGYKFDESVVCQSHFHQFHWGYLKGRTSASC